MNSKKKSDHFEFVSFQDRVEFMSRKRSIVLCWIILGRNNSISGFTYGLFWVETIQSQFNLDYDRLGLEACIISYLYQFGPSNLEFNQINLDNFRTSIKSSLLRPLGRLTTISRGRRKEGYVTTNMLLISRFDHHHDDNNTGFGWICF